MKKIALIALSAGALYYLSKQAEAKKTEVTEEKIDRTVEDSFPASDPPGFTNVSAS